MPSNKSALISYPVQLLASQRSDDGTIGPLFVSSYYAQRVIFMTAWRIIKNTYVITKGQTRHSAASIVAPGWSTFGYEYRKGIKGKPVLLFAEHVCTLTYRGSLPAPLVSSPKGHYEQTDSCC